MLLLALHIPQPRTPLQFCCPTSPKGAPGAFVENVAARYTPSTTFRGTLCCRVWTKGYSNTPPAQDPDWLTPWGPQQALPLPQHCRCTVRKVTRLPPSQLCCARQSSKESKQLPGKQQQLAKQTETLEGNAVQVKASKKHFR